MSWGVLVACSEDDKEEKETERVTPVELGEVTQGNLTMDRTFYGRTTPKSNDSNCSNSCR
ncbi:hypothetical protein [Gracilibacillus sp. JCM 18860]|uniref:hypothetical protein n=1 Tax=Gracilibacillus sp. JCM 18860 TaxID=1306159 RepID=UPI000A5BC735